MKCIESVVKFNLLCLILVISFFFLDRNDSFSIIFIFVKKELLVSLNLFLLLFCILIYVLFFFVSFLLLTIVLIVFCSLVSYVET